MDKIKTRGEIATPDKWNMEACYKNMDEVSNDIEKLKNEIDILASMQDIFLDSAENFRDYLKHDETASRLVDKLTIYSYCKKNEDSSVSTYQKLSGDVAKVCAEYNEKTSFVVPKILKMDEEKVFGYLDKYKELKPYDYFLRSVFNKKKHLLSEELEGLLSSYQPIFDASSETSGYLRNADMEFGMIQGEDRNEIELSEANYSSLIRSSNREVRKNAFSKLMLSYAKMKNTLTSTYNTNVNYDAITSRIRKYDSSIEMYLDPKKIPVALYNNLVKTVRENLSSLYEYFDLKKNILGLDEFHLYDGYVSVIFESDKKYTFDEAKDIVIDALKILGEDYIKVLKTAFSERWIDKYPNKGKRTGAYSFGVYDSLPYISLNFVGNYDDVSTLAHELGHSMHSYYTIKNNSYIQANYPIFLAEIASTTNELLLNHYMLEHATDKQEKLSILNAKLDLFKGTLYRQTMFAEFEQQVHEYVDAGNTLTSDYLCDLYYKLNQDYFGPSVVVDDEIRYEWLRIPHFYNSFYVYQYATSLSISCYIVDNIIHNTPGFKEKYIEFLSSGGRDYPLEVLKIIDIDLCDAKFFESAMNDFKDTLNQFRKIYYEE